MPAVKRSRGKPNATPGKSRLRGTPGKKKRRTDSSSSSSSAADAASEEARQVGWGDISLPRGHGLLALLRLPGVVVFPGETIPLRLLNTDIRALVHILLDTPSDAGSYHRWVGVQSFLRGTKTFGITSTSNIGCVVELRSIGSDATGEYCITRGCSRFKVIEDPDSRAAPLSLCCHINDRLPRGGVPKAAFDNLGTQLSYWPRSVWRRFDPAWLGQQLLSALHASRLGLDPPLKVISDPITLSFWVSANLPVDANFRLLLQEAPTCHMRCDLLLRMLRDLGELCCNVCGSPIASQQDVFSLSETGAAGTFVNPNGYVHQMLTLQSLAPESFAAVGEPETAHSWFPGYAWTICNCSTCLCHLGWIFTMSKTITLPLPSRNLSPNARVHWSKLAGHKKATRRLAALETFQQVGIVAKRLP